MADLSTDWELVSRRARGEPQGMLSTLHRLVARGAPQAAEPITWTLRHRATGRIRRLTARTELEAAVKIANGLFDAV
jgi:hypothetical protein